MMEKRWHETYDDIAISNKLWSIFDVLRGSISTSEYHLLLFLLSIFKDGLLEKVSFERKDSKRILIDEIRNSNDYQEIAEIYLPIIEKLHDRQFEEVIHLFSMFDRYSIEENFSSIFDYTLYKISDVLGKKEAGILQPFELTQFILDLSEIHGDERIYNPFAGLASFGVFLDKGQRYFGQEYSASTWAIGKLRLMAYGHHNHFEYKRDDSITNWPEHEQFDLIVSNPPMGMKLSQMYRFDYPEYKTLEPFLIERGISSLNDSGKLITVLPLGFLFRNGHEQYIRERIVEEDLLDTVISMPSGLLKYTSIPFCIIVLNKAKKRAGVVRFIDAQKYTSTEKSRDKRLNVEVLGQLIRSNSENESLRIVGNSLIREYDYNLNVPRYFAKEYDGKALYPDICTFFRGNQVIDEVKGKLIRIRDLKDDKVDNRLNVYELDTVDIPRSAKIIEESCLLVASRWKTLKPTYFKYEGEPIYVPTDIFSLRINEENINVYYLINELLSEDVGDQLNAFRLGGAVPSIRKDDLLNVKINVLPLEEQNAKVKGLFELSSQIKILQEERNALAHGVKSGQFNEFASLKHSIGAPRQNILSNAKSLIRFFERNQSDAFIEVNQAFKDAYEIDIIEVFKQVKEDINHISVILEKGEKGLILEDFPNELISLKEINAFIRGISENGYNFHLLKNYITNFELKQNGVECNITLLRVLLDNILKNAHKYGFKKNISSNEVVIDLQIIDDSLELTIKNNGLPFPKNFTKDKFISKYSTAQTEKGTGIGGYDINRIAIYLGDNNWVLDLDPSDIYPVTFKFSFVIKSLK
jgi:type I restriction enzyme M protein